MEKRVVFQPGRTARSPDGWRVLAGTLAPAGDGWQVESGRASLEFNFPGGGSRDFELGLDFRPGEKPGPVSLCAGAADYQLDWTARLATIEPAGRETAYASDVVPPEHAHLVFSAAEKQFCLDPGTGTPLAAPNTFPGRDIVAFTLFLPAGSWFSDLACTWRTRGASFAVPPRAGKFQAHVTVDFYDDLIHSAGPWTPETFDNLMAFHAGQGVSRIYWLYNGEAAHGYWENMAVNERQGPFPGLARKAGETRRNVPLWLKQAADSAHRHGMECFAVIKPCDMGLWGVVPADAPPGQKRVERIHGWAYWTTDLIYRHPHLREERCPAGAPARDERPFGRLVLTRDNDRPCAFDPRAIELWVSDENRAYRRYRGPVEISCRREPVIEHDYFPTPAGRRPAGPPVPRTVVTLDKLEIPEKFLILKTGCGLTFVNRLFRLVQAFDRAGGPLPFEFGLLKSFGFSDRPGADPREIGFAFCQPPGNPTGSVTDPAFLDPPAGMIGLARGREKHLVGHPFIGAPEVQEYLLGWVDECLAAGADGVDFRVHNHNRSFEFSAFGFQAPVRRAFLARHGLDIGRDPFALEDLRRLRGEFYTAFLRRAGEHLRARGRQIQVHVVAIYADADPAGFTYSNEIYYDWPAWFRAGLADAVTLVTGALRPRTDNLREIMRAARAADLPVYACPGLNNTAGWPDRAGLYDALIATHRREGLDGYILYENAAMLRARADGTIENLCPEFFAAVRRHCRR